jgi:hypothetical protein
VAVLQPELVDRNKNTAEVGERQKEVIDRVANLTVETTANNGRKADTVHTAKGVVGGEDETAFGRDMLLSAQVKVNVKIVKERAHEINAVLGLVKAQDVIDLILMHNADKVIDEKGGETTFDMRHLGAEDSPDVNEAGLHREDLYRLRR